MKSKVIKSTILSFYNIILSEIFMVLVIVIILNTFLVTNISIKLSFFNNPYLELVFLLFFFAKILGLMK